MLLLQNNHLNNGAIYTVRYFGGIKLGKGGLVKAYTESAKLALDNASIQEFILYQKMSLKASYHQFEVLEKELLRRNIQIVKKVFSNGVDCEIQFPQNKSESIKTFFSELKLKTYDIME